MIIECITNSLKGIGLNYCPLGRYYIVYAVQFYGEVLYLVQIDVDRQYPVWVSANQFKIISSVIPAGWHLSSSDEVGIIDLKPGVWILGYEEMVLTSQHLVNTYSNGFTDYDMEVFSRRKMEIDDYLRKHEERAFRLARPKGLWAEYD